MEITEKSVYDAFGLEMPAAEEAAEGADEKEQEPVDPVTPEAESGEKEEPEAAAPAEDAPGEDRDAEPPEEGEQKKEQTPEERKENAARRRREEKEREIRAAVEAAVGEEKKSSAERLKKLFQAAELKNTITGEKIESIDEFEAWLRAYNDERLQRDLKAGKLTRQAIKDMISEVSAESAQAEKPPAVPGEEMRRQIEAEFQQIAELDPSIHNLQEALAAPNGAKFAEYVRRGNTFVDAFYLANREQIEARRAQAARTQAMTNVRGKEHLVPAKAKGGAGPTNIPQDQMALFKLMMPDAKRADIQKYYDQYQKDNR